MIILDRVDLIIEAEGGLKFQLIFRLVLPVAAPCLVFQITYTGKALAVVELLYIIPYAVFINIGLVLSAFLVIVFKNKPGVDDRLSFKGILKIFRWNVDVRKDLGIRPPFYIRTGLFFIGFFLNKSGDIFSLFKMKAVFISVAVYNGIHIFRRVLRGAGSETVQSKAELIVFAGIVVVFSSGVELTEYQFPVVTAFPCVIIDGYAAAVVFYSDRMIGISVDLYLFSEALSGLVDGIA